MITQTFPYYQYSRDAEIMYHDVSADSQTARRSRNEPIVISSVYFSFFDLTPEQAAKLAEGHAIRVTIEFV